MGVNTQHLSLDTPSDSYLPGGLKNYSTEKMITYPDSTRKLVQENVFVFMVTILNLVTKVAQTFPKSDTFLFRLDNVTHIFLVLSDVSFL